MNLVKQIREKFQVEFTLLLIFIFAFIGIGSFAPDRFFTINNITSMAYQMPEFGLVALGMMVAILTGGINLSVATTASMSSIIAAFILSSELGSKSPIIAIIVAIIACLLFSVLAGMINGALIAYVGMAAMLATLGTMTLFEGISLNLTKGGAISGFPMEYISIGNKSFIGIPIPLIIYIAVVILTYFLLEKSAWGVKVHMIGSNETATKFSGINTKRTLFSVYIYSALMSALAGLIMISRYNSAKVDYGSSYLMQSVAAVVLGGTSISGGHGSVIGTVIAVAIIQAVSTGLNIIGIDRNIVDISIGGVLIVVLAIRHYTSILSNRAMIQERKKKSASL